MIPRRALSGLVACLVCVTACKKPVIESYRVPKEAAAEPAPAHAHGPAPGGATPTAAAPAGGATMASTPVPTASGAGLVWTAPANWRTKPGSAMRKGSYTIAGEAGEADMSVTAFPGTVGGELANLNRWREQIKLAPITAADLASSVQRIERNGLTISVVDIVGSGEGAQRILGAMVPHEGSTWFFKMQGPDKLVAKEKPAFMSLLETVKPAAATP